MAKDIKNKVVVITGGATSIGYEIADKFLQKEAKLVIILDINEKEGAEAVKLLSTKYGNNKAVFYKCDVTTDLETVWKKITDNHKSLDVLVNNAGIFNDQQTKKTIDINVLGVIDWSLKFWEYNRKDKSGNGGTIMNLASIYSFRSEPFAPVYHASKFAVLGFTRSLGHMHNFNRTGVRVVSICPGLTYTTLIKNLIKLFDDRIEDDFIQHTKKGLWQNADAVGNAAVEIFERADSGTAWLIEGNQPIEEVTV